MTPAAALLDRKAAELGVEPWAVWLAGILPGYCTHPFASHHAGFWRWVWDIAAEGRPRPFVGVWPRGGAKSTSAEAAVCMLGARGQRRYGLYVCDTQDRADDHVGNIGSMFESDRIEMFFPELGERRKGKHGNARGWRRNRLWTSSGFVVDAIGLDVAARGVKLEEQRPDFLVFDDIDGRHDSPDTTRRKVETITEAVIPAGADNVAVLAIQNLIHRDGVFARLVDGRADFLRRRVVSGPVPALGDFSVDQDGVVDGEPAWAGQSVDVCRAMVDDMGLRAFSRECQHDVAKVEGALWQPEMFEADGFRVVVPPPMRRVVVAIDPGGTSKNSARQTGIVAAGEGRDGDVYVLADRSGSFTPDGWARAAIDLYDEVEGDVVVGEINYGGEMVGHTVHTVDAAVPFEVVTASRGKAIRADPVSAMYALQRGPEERRVRHVGHLAELEEQLTGWVPGDGWSPDRLDALVWAVTQLVIVPGRRRPGFPVPAGAAA